MANTRAAGPANPNWKGGRSITPHGYVLLRMPGHPLADVRGYVYEHRLVAERKIGRPLKGSEVVHHVNHDTQDNRPENLEVLTRREHRAAHRRKDSGLRGPAESNDLIDCACGCGTAFARFDSSGRPRRYVSGHNTAGRKGKVMQ